MHLFSFHFILLTFSLILIAEAVPKRILDLMNVEKLTRENVASHLQAKSLIFPASDLYNFNLFFLKSYYLTLWLQKYRLYLKRISCVTSQQANIVAALGNADSAYLRMASLNGLGNLPTLDGSTQFQNAAFGSFRPSSVLGRLNSPAGLGMRSLSSSGMVQFGHAQNSSNPVNGLANFHSLSQSGNQNGNILYGMPMSLELDQLQHNQGVNHVGVLPVNDSMMYPISSGFSETKINVGSSSNPHFSISDDFSDTKINVGSSSNSLFGMPNNSLMVDGNLQDAHRRRVLGNQSSVTTSSLNSGFSSHLPDIERCNDNWPNDVQSSEVHSNLYTLNDCFKQTNLGILRDTGPSMMHMGNDSHDGSSINLAPAQYPDGKIDILQCQAGSGSSGIGQNINVTLQQGWDDSKQDASHQSYLLNSSLNSLLPHDVASPFNSRSNLIT